MLNGRRSYGSMNNVELRILVVSVIKLQRWWRGLLLDRSRMDAVISVQASVRGWIARRDAAKRKQSISIVQAGF